MFAIPRRFGRIVGMLPRIALMLALLLASFAAVAPAMAAAVPVLAHGYKMAGDDSRVRIVLYFDREPQLHSFLLRAPYRLVIDLPGARFGIDPGDTSARGLISAVHYGATDEGTSRIVLVSKGPFEVEKLDVVANESSPGYRMVVDLVATSPVNFDRALAKQAKMTLAAQSTAKDDRLGEPRKAENKRFTVVIDPGHGGIDGGAKGVSGTLEKSITLAFGLELRARLQQDGKYDVYMTRDDDTFLRLDDRVRVAREHDADLLISIHADSIHVRGIRGATIYTVSDRASDAESAALAARENLSDQLAGMEVDDENHEVSDILMDLIRRETHAFSMRFARSLVGELSHSIELINNPHRYAGFRVLKAPDVPSVLLELGYLSNAKDEAELRDPEWRGKAIDSIVGAIDQFAAARIGG